jgi:hypothetical protein
MTQISMTYRLLSDRSQVRILLGLPGNTAFRRASQNRMAP